MKTFLRHSFGSHLVDLVSDSATVEHHPVIRVHRNLYQEQTFERSMPTLSGALPGP